MKKEDLITEIASLIGFINEARDRITIEHDKFQIALTNTLRLLGEGSPILTKMKGNVEDLKAYLIRTSTEIRQISLNPYDDLRVRVERINEMVQAL
ncbi:MAG: hypothetical protein AM326_02580 [Candidatus Thorarchaeota archaeon SMTZ-45]|nr:MAG: hypothetical protein AM325_00845 [Candidatus Thorarchaeota archaeon SMTZ1-45]KXH76487.1 MAG: hypothetical protein AM326_02580 [Candidatus Thorarchaeota archaeon SMTZ-45]